MAGHANLNAKRLSTKIPMWVLIIVNSILLNSEQLLCAITKKKLSRTTRFTNVYKSICLSYNLKNLVVEHSTLRLADEYLHHPALSLRCLRSNCTASIGNKLFGDKGVKAEVLLSSSITLGEVEF